MGTLPSTAIDLIRDGLTDSASLTRRDVHVAMRTAMILAHRNGVDWPTMHAFLTDKDRNVLARQIATGRRGKAMNQGNVTKILSKAWDDTKQLVDKSPTWTCDDVFNIIEEIQVALEGSILPERQRKVMEAAIKLGFQKGTTRPTLPARTIAEMTGIPKTSVGRILGRLAEDGDWLRLARRGNAKQGRANIYRLAPAIADTYRAATPPMPHDPPMSHPPMSHLSVVGPGGEVLTLSAEKRAAIERILAMPDLPDMTAEEDHLGVALAKVLPLHPPPFTPELGIDEGDYSQTLRRSSRRFWTS